MKIIVLLLISLAFCQSRLLTNSMMFKSHAFKDDYPSNFQCPTNNFTKLDVSEIVKNFVNPQKAPPADSWIAYQGYQKNTNDSTNACFGYIFWGAQAAKGKEEDLKNYPVLVWLQGGPGGSSQYGNFYEMGPIMVFGDDVKKYTYKYNEWSWNVDYSMLFVDNPVGVGISHAERDNDIPINQDQVGQHFYYMISQLYQQGLFKKLNLQSTSLFITGESYAGKYVPSVAQRILKENTQQTFKVPLKGIAVGDGFTNPQAIQQELGNFGFNLGMLDIQEKDNEFHKILKGNLEIAQGEWLLAQRSFDDIMDYLASQSGLEDAYNFMNTRTPSPLNLDQFLNNLKYKKIFGLPADLVYRSSSGRVYSSLSMDFMKTDCVQRLEEVLSYKDFPVLYYNGQNDIIVCTPCTESWLDYVNYSGNDNKEFLNAQFTPWNATKADKTSFVAGFTKSSKNLMFATVNNAGHMVPTDQPEAAYALIKNWVEAHK